MTKAEKIASLANAMTTSKRDNGEVYHHFTDTAPVELKEIFMTHYQIADMDYETFSKACSMVSEIYNDTEQDHDGLELIEDQITERVNDSASYYTSDRLEYLDVYNEDEISQIMREYGEHSIATACAIWYDRQIEQQAMLIKDWVNEA